MPNALTNVRVDPLLSGIASGHKNAKYIADLVLPVVTTQELSGKIGGYGYEHYRLDFNARSIGGDAHRVDWQPDSQLSFDLKEWTVEKPVDDREVKLYQDPFDAYADAALFLQEKILLKREDLVGTLMSTSGNFGGTATSGTAWGTPGTGTPVTDIRAAKSTLVGRTGASESELYGVCSFSVWSKLVQTTEVKNLYLSTVPGAAGPETMKPRQLAEAIGLADIYVGTAVKLTSAEAVAETKAFSYVWGSTTFSIFAKSARPSLMQPGFGLILASQIPGLNGVNVAVDRYREEKKRSTIIRAGALFDQLGITKNMGQIITGIS